MPKTEIDYSNTIFYKIRCKNPDVKDVYIGHTINFVQRKCAHKRSCTHEKSINYNFKVYNVIREFGGWDNWNMEIIAVHDCEDHYGARKLEQKYFEEHNATLNSIEPLPNPKAVQLTNPVVYIKSKILNQEKSNVNLTHELDKNADKNIKNDMNRVETTFTPNIYECQLCKFKCSKKSNYMTHLTTAKHKLLTENADLTKHYICTCGKKYKHRQSLYTHKLICADIVEVNNNNSNNNIESSHILDLIKQNNEFKQMVIEQTNQMLELAKKHTTTYTS